MSLSEYGMRLDKLELKTDRIGGKTGPSIGTKLVRYWYHNFRRLRYRYLVVEGPSTGTIHWSWY